MYIDSMAGQLVPHETGAARSELCHQVHTMQHTKYTITGQMERTCGWHIVHQRDGGTTSANNDISMECSLRMGCLGSDFDAASTVGSAFHDRKHPPSLAVAPADGAGQTVAN